MYGVICDSFYSCDLWKVVDCTIHHHLGSSSLITDLDGEVVPARADL
jgi:hypothetical protein